MGKLLLYYNVDWMRVGSLHSAEISAALRNRDHNHLPDKLPARREAEVWVYNVGSHTGVLIERCGSDGSRGSALSPYLEYGNATAKGFPGGVLGYVSDELMEANDLQCKRRWVSGTSTLSVLRAGLSDNTAQPAMGDRMGFSVKVAPVVRVRVFNYGVYMSFGPRAARVHPARPIPHLDLRRAVSL